MKTKKIMQMLVIGAILIGILASCNTGNTESVEGLSGDSEDQTANPSEKKNKSTHKSGDTIDIILVAGQSNATGTTKVNAEEAYEILPELKISSYPCVLTGGVVRSTNPNELKGYYRRDIDWQTTRLGMGKTTDYMGPEVGMAKELSAFYNLETDRAVGILKYGHGGTSLLNDTSDSNQFGNWVPPSYAEKKGYAYEGATGGLYREFLQVVGEKLGALKSRGYTDFNILGLYWMQGEQDRQHPNDYKEAFSCLVEDLRSDLSEVVKSVTGGDDKGVSELPIWVGTISRTFWNASDADQAVNAAFILMQKKLANAENKIFVVNNSKYDVNVQENGVSKPVGSDNCHWSQADHIQIGRNVGRKILIYYGFIE